jgi:hypothetical protein
MNNSQIPDRASDAGPNTQLEPLDWRDYLHVAGEILTAAYRTEIDATYVATLAATDIAMNDATRDATLAATNDATYAATRDATRVATRDCYSYPAPGAKRNATRIGLIQHAIDALEAAKELLCQ